MTSSTAWRPIIEGELAARITESIHETADEIRKRKLTDSDGPSFAGGDSGLALVFTYLGEAFPDRDYRAAAEQFLDRAVDAVAEMPLPAAFYGGFTGVAWVYEHLQGRLFEASEEDLNEGIDDALGQLLEHTPWQFDYDLISGLVGFGVYALERRGRPGAALCAERIYARLSETAVERSGGLTWLTPSSLMIPETAERYPDGYYNLGLAHGVPGVIAILAELLAAGMGNAEARRLLDGAVAWTLASRRTDPQGSAFSYYIDPRNPEQPPSRSAWCYGDPGATAALMVAARAVNQPEWERIAVEAALKDARRPPGECGVVDAGLCHGATGLAHILNRFYQGTGDVTFADAARYWYERALELRRPGGVGGYFAWAPKTIGEELSWVEEEGLLTGAGGVIMALASAVAPVEPAWDRSLMVAIPPRAD